jgi:predicted TPR repeat methyltransferase
MSAPTRSNRELLAEAQAHVAAGRHDAARAGAQAVLAHHPANAEAHALMALCELASRQPGEALAHAELALKRERTQAPYHHLAALCLEALGRMDEALAADARALRLQPALVDARIHSARLLERAGRLDEAAQAYRAALQVRRNDPALMGMLGYCEVAAGRAAQGLPLIRESIRLRRDLSATSLERLGEALMALGHGAEAIEPLRRATRLDPSLSSAWTLLGEQLYISRDDAGALECLERALVADPGDETARFLREVVAGGMMDHPPERFVSNFFDRFAADFDRHLVQDLEYCAPERIAAALGPWLAQRSGLRVADLGCGTGLSGVFVRPRAARLVGVDLSEGMLEKARARAIYDELERDDIARYLNAAPAAAFDLLLAADVFIYVGRLEEVFAACARALAPGGRFAFSIEILEGAEDVRLARSGRYAHSRAYVERLGRGLGLATACAVEGPIRSENKQPVAGRIVVMEKPAAG